MGKAIVFTGGKGGTGKTTAAAAVGSCLAARGKRVLCIDCDLGLGNLDLALGIEGAAVTDLKDAAEDGRPLEETVYRHPVISGLDFLPPVHSADGNVAVDDMKRLVDRAKQSYDFVLLDSPAGFDKGFRLALCGADIAILVCTWDSASLRDGQRAAQLLRKSGIEQVRLILNRTAGELVRKTGRTADDAIDETCAQLLGIVPEDAAVASASAEGYALVLYGREPAARAFLRIAGRLLGEEIPIGRL